MTLSTTEHTDFDKVSLSPDMFKPETYEEIGQITKSRDKWIATPYGTTATVGSHTHSIHALRYPIQICRSLDLQTRKH